MRLTSVISSENKPKTSKKSQLCTIIYNSFPNILYPHQSINQVLCYLMKVIMTFHASGSLIAFSASVTHPTFSQILCPSNIFLHCFPLQHFLSIIPVVTRCSSFSFFIKWPKEVVFMYHFYE